MQKRKLPWNDLAMLALLLAFPALAGEMPFVGAPPATPRTGAFAVEPTTAKAAGGCEIRFTVKSETDATVEILDAKGKVVRHLASGVLGDRAPEPFKAGSLAQTLLWDGKDDQGQIVSGPCTVRVALGLKPELDTLMGGSGQNPGNASSLACGPDGTLYYLFCAGEGHHTAGETFILAFDRNGKYLRQLMPMPANLSREQVSGTSAMALGEKGWMPVLYHGLVHTLYPNITGIDRQGMCVSADGKLYLAGPNGAGKYVLLRLGLDGSAGKDFVGPVIGESYLGSSIHLAVSPDGKHVYASGLVGGARWKYKPLHNMVYRGETAGDKPFEAYITASDGGLNDPRGICCDKQGNLYVAEAGANRVSVWSPDKKLLGSLSVPSPDMVAVHPKTGAVYVLSSPTKVNPESESFMSGGSWFGKKKLLKFNSYKDAKEAAAVEFPEKNLSGGRSVMTLDPGSEPASIWIGGWAYGKQIAARKIIDKGTQFEVQGDPIREQNKDKFPYTTPENLSVDRQDTVLLVNGLRVNPATGEGLGPVPFQQKFHKQIGRYDFGEEEVAAAGDFMVHRSGFGQVVRMSADGSALAPFTGGSAFVEPKSVGAQPVVEQLFGGFMHPRGHELAPNACTYVIHHQKKFRNRHATAVSEVGADGNVKRYEFITLDGPAACVRVDRKGHVYLGTTIRPASESKPHNRIDEGGNKWSVENEPSWVRGKLPAVEGSWFLTPGFWYTMCTGSVVKFSPSGGKVTRNSGPHLLGTDTGGDIAWMMAGNVEGGVWAYHGVSPMPYKGGGANAGGCICETARFDLDGHDRLFVPEALKFSVSVLDSNGNFICRFGSYGNMDSRGAGSAISDPAIPLGWPMAVAVSDKSAYVADYTNFRIAKVKLAYTVEKSVPAAK